jgi:twitching motility protein PilT
MASQSSNSLLGRLALHNKLITADQLAEATQERGRRGDNVRLGDVLVEKGWISSAQLAALVAKQRELVARHRAAQAAEQAAPVPTPAAARPAPAAAPQPAPAAAPEPPPAAAAPPPQPAPAARARVSGPSPELEALLRSATQCGASDLHVHSASPVKLRRNGCLENAEDEALAPEAAEAWVRSCLDAEQAARFDEAGELDFAYTLPGVGRFRVNAYRQQRGVDAVFRVIPAAPPSLEALGLPLALARLTNHHQGMVLLTGPAGCGKSSTLAALLDIINEERRAHVLTIEDPIETLHPSKRCVVNQRQVGPHTGSFARALRAALREDPDVICIGELRDRETISLALTAAETGHFVLATLHTDNSIRTVNRLVGAFPLDQQDQVRTMISESLRAVVSQRLVRTSDDSGRLPALEVLHVNKAVGNLIRENKTFQIHSILQTGGAHGMQLLDQSLAELVRSGAVDRQDALRQAEDPRRISGAGG